MRRLPLILIAGLLCLLPPAVYFGLRASDGPIAARIAAFPFAMAALAAGVLLAGALLGAMVPTRTGRWSILAAALICCAPVAICATYHGEYEEEFRVESLAWQLGRMPAGARVAAPQYRELLRLRETTKDWECRVNISGKFTTLQLPAPADSPAQSQPFRDGR